MIEGGLLKKLPVVGTINEVVPRVIVDCSEVFVIVDLTVVWIVDTNVVFSVVFIVDCTVVYIVDSTVVCIVDFVVDWIVVYIVDLIVDGIVLLFVDSFVDWIVVYIVDFIVVVILLLIVVLFGIFNGVSDIISIGVSELFVVIVEDNFDVNDVSEKMFLVSM